MAVTAIVVVGLGLRLIQYTASPSPADNRDEFAWAWSGLTLITRHVPYAWSYLHVYHSTTDLVAYDTTFRIVHPWLDHPPLFGLIVGAFAWLRGARDLTDVSVEMIRPVAIGLSLISIVLAYALARRVLGRWPALAGAFLLATAPVAVLFSHQVESEALLAPLLLAALILVHRLLTGETTRLAAGGLFALCLAASLTKVPGLAVGAGCALVLLSAGRWRLALLTFSGATLGIALYAAYGAVLDWNLFLAVLRSQGERRHGVMAAWEFIAAPAGIGRGLRDGWWLLGWLGIGIFLARARDSTRLLTVPLFIYVAALVILSDQRVVNYYGWYRISVYPIVYLGAAALLSEAFAFLSIPAMAAVIATGGATATTVLFGQHGQPWMPPAWLVALVVVAALVPLAIAGGRSDSDRTRAVARVAAGGVIILILLANVVESLFLATTYTEY